jgi:hypothetical protein
LSTRYLSNLALALIAGFVVVASQSFSSSVFTWLAFGGGVAIVVIALAEGARDRVSVHRAVDAVTAVIGAWTIVSSLVFSASTVVWLGFSAANAVVGLAVIGLTLHELRDERLLRAVDSIRTSEHPTTRAAGLAS